MAILAVGDRVVIEIPAMVIGHRSTFQLRTVTKITRAGYAHCGSGEPYNIKAGLPASQNYRRGLKRNTIIRKATAADIEEFEAKDRARKQTNDDPDRELREKAQEAVRQLLRRWAPSEHNPEDVQIILDAMKWAQTK